MNALSQNITRIHFEPFLADHWIIAIGVLAAALFFLSLWKHRNAVVFRFITLGLFILALLNPVLLQKEREPTKDIAVVVVDKSSSQNMGKRNERTQEALEHLKQSLSSRNDLELRVIEAPQNGELSNETNLFDAVERSFANVPLQRRAGLIFITDGQIHDVPMHESDWTQYGPVHALLSGNKHEKDRRLEIIEAPSYGIVGARISVKYKIIDTDNIDDEMATVTLQTFDGEPDVFFVPVGEEQIIDLDLNHAGENIFELSVQGVDGEITEANNRAALEINGVRDRLKVLLVSGKPHAGGRTWRDLLKSDPGVDLVHFTILREPEKLDATPQNELALIAFPFRELFEIKLYDFDLIIFDRYRLNRILPQYYFNNIATYVKQGGALLEASGPAFASEDSVYYTDLGTILPAKPDGKVMSAVFKPHISKLGLHHPVTENLDLFGGSLEKPGWGSWLRQVSLSPGTGETLMTGIDEKPLLVLDRVQQGRVAQIASDHIWLWSRGYDGGGPHAELLRRVVHWLMKEPELDEKALDIQVKDNDIRIRSRDAQADTMSLTMTKPDGVREDIVLERDQTGFLQTHITADQLGIYAFSDGEDNRRFAIIGEQNPPELRDVLTSDEKLKPLIQASHGGTIWLQDTPHPSVRQLSNTSYFAGRNWIGLRANNDFTVKSVKSQPLMPPWAWFALLGTFLLITWWREGRSG